MKVNSLTDEFDEQWNAAVEKFDGGESDDEFMSALRDMVGELQMKAYRLGIESASRHRVSAQLNPEDTRYLVLALLEGRGLDIGIEPWQDINPS